jgi:PAS domain S-box-containing protein
LKGWLVNKAYLGKMQGSIDNSVNESYRYEALFNHASMGIVVVNAKGEIESVNPFALNLFGYTIEEIIARPIEVLIPQRYHQHHVGDRNNFITRPKSRPMGVGLDLFAVKKDGTEFAVEVSLGNYKNNDDTNVIAFISDISVRKKAEAQIVRLNDELEATVLQRTLALTETLQRLSVSSERLEAVLSYQKTLLDNAGVMIIATDKTGLIKLFNPESAANTGYEESEVIDQQSLVIFHDKDEIDKKRNFLLTEFGISIADDFAVLVEKARRDIHTETQYTYLRKDGSSFPASLRITAVKDNAGEITGFMSIAIDVTERKKIEEDLNKALEKEKDLNELKSRFVSMASHEFRTPLSTVLSSAYLIEKYKDSDDQLKRAKHLERIYSSVNMLTDILNDFLSVGKIEEGKIGVRITECHISDIVSQVIEEIRINLRDSQQIHYTHEGGMWWMLDASLLKHILMNLVSNASKFSADVCCIDIHTFITDDLLTLSVKDHGIGISADDQKHLMERFFRGGNAANIQGTGLGLHIVSKYAELMNGAVACKSKLGEGTEFLISFSKSKK